MSYPPGPPHGGHTITHSPHCLGDCGHEDCMGCCGCPPEEWDANIVEQLTTGDDWLADWYRAQIVDAWIAGRDAALATVEDGQVGKPFPTSEGIVTAKYYIDRIINDVRRLTPPVG